MQPEVGWRGAAGNYRRRGFLKIVWRQHVFSRRRVSLEIAPSLAGNLAQRLRLVPCRFRSAGRRAAAYTRCNGRRRAPSRRKNCDDRERVRRDEQCDRAGRQCHSSAAQHIARVTKRNECRARLGLGRCDPFQQISSRDEEPVERTRDSVDHPIGLIGKENQAQQGVGDGQSQIRRRCAPASAPRVPPHAWNQIKNRRHQRRQRNGRDNRQTPDQGRAGRPRPA